jgi:asparagine N-glycosylation enzyme membrane subunit Stt3
MVGRSVSGSGWVFLSYLGNRGRYRESNSASVPFTIRALVFMCGWLGGFYIGLFVIVFLVVMPSG